MLKRMSFRTDFPDFVSACVFRGICVYLRGQKATFMEYSGEMEENIAEYSNLYTYWNVVWLIVEDEQNSAHCAEYGKQVLKELSKRLTKDFWKGDVF